MIDKLSDETRSALFEYLLRYGDDRLILGHRLSEWCGHAPILEEDIALANIALDCVGQANALLTLAAEVENKNRTADDLAYFREAVEFKNLQLVEQPNLDFAYTIVRQFFYDAFAVSFLEGLKESKIETLAGMAGKSLKEAKYHLRHSGEWLLRLGDGTEESNKKIQTAVNDFWGFTKEMWETDEVDELLHSEKIAPDIKNLKSVWDETVHGKFEKAKIRMPDDDRFFTSGSRKGIHTEHLGHLLAEMQIVARSFPGAKW